MRVHQLSLSAFGPFAGTVSVDLDEVGADGLFLLWGPTGAGKTTLLDAVVFALYGTVPGARGHEKRLRSDHATADVRTEVRCEVTLGGERLRITRRPEQQRPKKRGAGSTTEQAMLVVQRLTDGGWEPVSTRIDEGSEHLRTRLGLSAEQFCQVVLLPQGDFARFLRAEPDDRGRLLRTLFDVGRFARAEDWLAEERRRADELTRAARAGVSTVLARVAQVADMDVPEELAPDLVGAAGLASDRWVGSVCVSARERAAGGTVAADAARAALDAWEAELSSARSLAERHARRDRARTDLDRLAVAEVHLEQVRVAVDAGRRAEPLRDVLEDAGRVAGVAEEAAATLTAAQAEWVAVAGATPADTLTARRLRDEAAAARTLLPEVARAAGLEQAAAALSREVRESGASLVEAETQLAGRPAARAAAESAVAEAAQATARQAGLAARAHQLAGVATASEAAVVAQLGLAAAEAAVLEGREVLVAARERAADLRTARLEGMAAELAAGLHGGGDCPVCGSTDHPRLAVHDGAPVTLEQEDAARVAVDRADDVLQAAVSEREQWAADLAVARAVAGDVLPAEAVAAWQDAQQHFATVQLVAAGAQQAEQLLARIIADTDRQDQQLVRDRTALAARTAERDAARAAHADLVSVLATSVGEDRDLPARMRRLTREADLCEAVGEASAADLRARADLIAASQRATDRAVEAGFTDARDAAGALVDREELDRMSSRLTEHDRATDLARGVLAEPDLIGLAPAPDLAAVDTAVRAARTTRETAVAESLAATRRVADLEVLVGALTAVRVELDERRGHADHVGSMADLVNGRGSNTLRMRLQSFVLAARLEQVAEVASRRLQDMSGGRYTFLHSDALGRNGARGGLGLDVFDEHTGVRRPTKTLSGGESFMASLALALGLADVVTAESGGVQIDTLFVDEGFGSLDPQALDAVMSVLDELRRGGRTVGVVSHVEELRTRIPSRIEVIAGRDGSRLAA